MGRLAFCVEDLACDLMGHFVKEHLPYGIPGVVGEEVAAEGDFTPFAVPQGKGTPGLIEGEEWG